MRLRNIANFLLFIAILITGGCKTDEIPPIEIIGDYTLTVTPLTHNFPVEGGELTLEITATKTTSKISEGEVLEKNEEDISFITTVSEEWLSISGNIVIAEENSEDERSGTITITIEGTDLQEIVTLAQDGIEVEEEEEEEETSDRVIRVLAIGNSYSVDAVEQYLHEIADSQGDTIIIGNMYIGSSTLELHYSNSLEDAASYQYRKVVDGERINRSGTTLAYALDDEEWDIVTLQQSSPNSGLPYTYSPYFDHMISYVKENTTNPDLKIAFHMTWAWADGFSHSGYSAYNNKQLTMYNAIVSTMQSVVSPKVDFIIPVGTAIQNARSSLLGDSFNRDGTHLNYNYGRYTAALTWYQKLFGKSVVGITYAPDNVTPFQTEVAQQAAHNAVEDPYEITSLAHLVNNDPPPPMGAYMTFTTTRTSSTIRIRINANPEDQEFVWIDLNNNKILDPGEEVTNFGTNNNNNRVNYAGFSPTFTIYGKVTNLEINGQNITSADVNNNPYMESLNLPFNEIEELDVSELAELNYLQVGVNLISEIDLSNNPKLGVVQLNANKLTSVILPDEVPDLRQININRNRLSEPAINHIVERLTDRNELTAGNFYWYVIAPHATQPDEQNATTVDISPAQAKNWTVYVDLEALP